MRNVEESATFLKSQYQRHDVPTPQWHVVLGTGFSGALDAVLSASQATRPSQGWNRVFEIPFSAMPGMPQAKVHGHAGKWIYCLHTASGMGALMQAGRIHGYEGHEPDLVTLPVVASKFAGCENFLLTNAAGSLKRTWPAGSLMVIQDHFNLTGQNPLVGPNLYGERFPDMGTLYDPALSKLLQKCVTQQKLKCGAGTYVGVLGPSFETPAEVRTFSRLGFGAVGMSTVWEAISLKHAGATVVGLSYLSNMGCGLAGKAPLDHVAILEIMHARAEKALAGILEFLQLSATRGNPSPRPRKTESKKSKRA